MRYVFLSVWLLGGFAQADCIERVAETQAQVLSLTGEMDDIDRTRLTAMLLALCRQREPGSSVTKTAERNVITTHGLNEKQVVVDEDDIPVFVGIDLDIDAGRDDRGERRPDRGHKIE